MRTNNNIRIGVKRTKCQSRRIRFKVSGVNKGLRTNGGDASIGKERDIGCYVFIDMIGFLANKCMLSYS